MGLGVIGVIIGGVTILNLVNNWIEP
jgi:hypothetical protein